MAAGTETGKKPEVATGHALDSHQSERRQTLNARLRRWGRWLLGGLTAGAIGAWIWPAAAFISVPLIVGGAIAEVVGLAGMYGNEVKTWFKKNK